MVPRPIVAWCRCASSPVATERNYQDQSRTRIMTAARPAWTDCVVAQYAHSGWQATGTGLRVSAVPWGRGLCDRCEESDEVFASPRLPGNVSSASDERPPGAIRFGCDSSQFSSRLTRWESGSITRPRPSRGVPPGSPPSAVWRGAGAAATSPHALSRQPVTGKPLADAPTVGSMSVRPMPDTSAEMNASCDASGPW
jgi:hypothetical protein